VTALDKRGGLRNYGNDESVCIITAFILASNFFIEYYQKHPENPNRIWKDVFTKIISDNDRELAGNMLCALAPGRCREFLLGKDGVRSFFEAKKGAKNNVIGLIKNEISSLSYKDQKMFFDNFFDNVVQYSKEEKILQDCILSNQEISWDELILNSEEQSSQEGSKSRINNPNPSISPMKRRRLNEEINEEQESR
jgi:hypothetical protein